MRTAVAALLTVAAAVAVCLVVIAYWSDSVLLDTDTFVAAMEPLVDDDAVRDEASDRISDTLLELFDLRELARSVLPGAEQLISDEMVAEFETLVRQTVTAAVATDTFGELWLAEMRSWHRGWANAVRSAQPDSVADDAAMQVTLGPYIDLLAEEVEEPLVHAIIVNFVPDPVRQIQVEVFDAGPIADRLAPLGDLQAARPYLAWGAAAAFLLALIVAPVRGYVLMGGGLALVAGSQVALRIAHAEAARMDSLMRSAFSASSASTAESTDALLGPLEAWMGYLTSAGVLVGVIGIAMLWFRSKRRDGARHSAPE